MPLIMSLESIWPNFAASVLLLYLVSEVMEVLWELEAEEGVAFASSHFGLALATHLCITIPNSILSEARIGRNSISCKQCQSLQNPSQVLLPAGVLNISFS